jgi:RecA/RadA recombinase
MTAVPVVAKLSPFLRHFSLSLSVSACYNPIENQFSSPRISCEETGKTRSSEHFEGALPMAIADDRAKAVELALAQIEKQFGKGSIVRLGSKEALMPIAVISTGSISFDAALGVGGIPRGRVTEVFGPESSGKTTITLQIIAEAQRLGGLAAFVDAEHALDPGYAKKLGVDVDNLLVSQPDSGEQALEITEALVKSGAIDVLVLDSVAALVPKAELDGEMGDSHMGLQARLMSQALRKLTGSVSKSRTALIFINQIREKIGVMFGNPETTTGWARIEVLLVGARGYSTDCSRKRRRCGDGIADEGEDRQEQGGCAVPRGRVRHSLRGRHQPRGRRSGPGGCQQHC